MRLCSYSFLGGMSSSLGKGPCFGILSFEVKNMKTQISCDILIAGGGLGGCAAALSACRLGQSVVLTEECDWIGGQLTSQAVSAPDEHPWIESFGGTETWARLRNGIRQYYKAHYPLVPSARAKSRLNPGNGDVSALCHEPRVALAVLEEIVHPGMKVFDLGTGSGILAIAAAKLGAEVAAVDLDAVAVQVAQENVQLNMVADRVRVLKGDLGTVLSGQADLVIANIIADVIIALLQDLPRLLHPQGEFLASGIIESRVPEVEKAMRAKGLEIVERREDSGWILIRTRWAEGVSF